jgi:hypothetical protein
MKVVTDIVCKDGIIEVDKQEVHPQVVTFDELIRGSQRFRPDWWRFWVCVGIVLWIANGALFLINQCSQFGK